MSRIKIILVDDHQIFLEGLKELLEQHPGLEVVATAQNGDDLLVKMKSYHVNVVVLDIQMPGMNGIATAEEMKQKYPDVRMLVLSMHSDRTFVQRVYDVGIQGYLTKNTDSAELVEAIRNVHAGKRHFKTDAALSFLDKRKNTDRNAVERPALSKREAEILMLIAKEYSNPDIAEMLHLSVETVNTHRKNMLQKLGVKNTAGLVKYAIYNKLIEESQ